MSFSGYEARGLQEEDQGTESKPREPENERRERKEQRKPTNRTQQGNETHRTHQEERTEDELGKIRAVGDWEIETVAVGDQEHQ